MSDKEVVFLETLLNLGFKIYYAEPFNNGELIPIRSITHNHRDQFLIDGTHDPQETPESVAWVANKPVSCIGLMTAQKNEFKLMAEIQLNWPD